MFLSQPNTRPERRTNYLVKRQGDIYELNCSGNLLSPKRDNRTLRKMLGARKKEGKREKIPQGSPASSKRPLRFNSTTLATNPRAPNFLLSRPAASLLVFHFPLTGAKLTHPTHRRISSLSPPSSLAL